MLKNDLNLPAITIEADRVLLAPISLEYKDDIFREFDKEIMRYMTPKPAEDMSETEAFINSTQNKMTKSEELVCCVLLKKTKEFIYNPESNANVFGFYLVDNEGVEKKVMYNGTKPQDFERSEQIVVIGKMEGDEFHANQLLMKCPSKYNGNQQDQMKAVNS